MNGTRTLPADVRALLDNLAAAPRLQLANALLEVRDAVRDDKSQDFRRGLVAGLIAAAEYRGELSSRESGDLLEFALGFRGLS